MKQNIKSLVLLSLLLLLLSACGGGHKNTLKPQLTTKFDSNINELILETAASCRGKLAALAPAAIVSTNSLRAKAYTGLDEFISKRLAEKLSQDREIITLSRENWFELKESGPLSFKGHSRAHYKLVENIVIFIIDVEAQPLFDRIKVTITAKDSKLRLIPGISGQTMLESYEDSPGNILINTAANSNPLPSGLKENPYNSMEQMCYSLASELSFALEKGVSTGSYQASEEEIQIMLCSKNFSGPNPKFNRAMIQELQHSLASMEGMTCTVSQEDFASIFKQMEFYNRNDHIFEIDNEKLKPGSVFLMARTKSTGNKNQIALRAIWRISPLTDKAGSFIPDNTAGTYVSGFTSRAWFEGVIPEVSASPQYYEPDKRYKKVFQDPELENIDSKNIDPANDNPENKNLENKKYEKSFKNDYPDDIDYEKKDYRKSYDKGFD